MSNRLTKLLSKLVPSQSAMKALRAKLENKAANSLWLCVAVLVIAIIGMALYGYLYALRGEWQFLALAVTALVEGVAAAIGFVIVRRNIPSRGIWPILVVMLALLVISPIFVAGLGLWYSATIILSTLVFSSLTLSATDNTRAIIIGVAGGLLALVVGEYVNYWQASTTALIAYYLVGVVILFLIAYLLILALYFPDYNLRAKIAVAVFSTVLVSTIILATINSQTYRTTLINNANQTLLLAASRTASDVDVYLGNLIAKVQDITGKSIASSVFLSLSPEYQSRADELVNQIRGYKEQLGALELLLLDRDGSVVFHSASTELGEFKPYIGLGATEQAMINTSMLTGAPFVSSVIFSSHPQISDADSPYIYIGARVTDSIDNPAGMMLVAYPIVEIQKIVEGSTGLAGDQSFAVLLDDNYMRVAHGASPDVNYTLVYPLSAETFDQLQQENRLPSQGSEPITSNYQDYKIGLDRLNETPFFEAQEVGIENDLGLAAGVHLSQKNWTLIYLQNRSVTLAPITQQNRTTILITVLVGGIAIVISSLLAKLISDPIVQLTGVAGRASAGDLGIKAPVSSTDEVGKLGDAFNSMIDQLRLILQGLEERVRERTIELSRTTEQLEYRADRLQMVAEVAHAFAAVRDPDQLLSLVVNTISERFGFYHVGIFWVDEAREFAVLVAANSEGGKRMLARGHRLRVGAEGLVGHVTHQGEARIALDVGQDAVFFNNPDLPETRSEITLPMKVGTKIIGALDVQSTMPRAFDASDIALLSTLADQVAMAIENTRLITEAQRTVRELELAQSQYIHQEWSKLLGESGQEGYQYSYGRLAPIDEPTMGASAEILPTAPIVTYGNSSEDGEEQATGLSVPILLRGQIIGLIELKEVDTPRKWAEDEINLVAAVADQVGQALENARLLETTQRRAERERLVSEITTKLRSTNDPQEILETAVQQLKNALQVRKVQVRVVKNPDHEDVIQETS